MGVRVCPPRPSPLPPSLARSPPLPPALAARLSSLPRIYPYLFGVRSLRLPLSLPPPGSPLSPRSGASGAPPLARRDVARGDVDAALSGALDVCVQPGPGLQSRRRPLRRLLEQQQPQVRWPGRGRRELGLRGPGPGAGDTAAGSGAHQPQAARALGACVARRRWPPGAGGKRSLRAALCYATAAGPAAARNPQGCAEPLPPTGCGEDSGLGGSSGPGPSLPSRGDWLAPPDPGSGLGC